MSDRPYSIAVTTRADKDLDRLPEKVATACVEFLYGPLAENPRRVGKPLTRQLDGLHAARRGTYRVVYSIHDHTVSVEVVRGAHRADAYR